MVDERSKKYRWTAQVEKAANKLNSLLADPPDHLPRQPEINTRLIDRLVALTNHTPKAATQELKITFAKQERNQRDWMRELAVKYHWDQQQVVNAYAKLDSEGKTPRRNRSQDSLSYAKALWSDGVQKGWLRDTDGPDFKADVGSILRFLNAKRYKATYNAVASALGIHHTQMVQLFPKLGTRRAEASWVVNKDTLEPTKYSPEQRHPDLDNAKRIITDGAELRTLVSAWLKQGPD